MTSLRDPRKSKKTVILKLTLPELFIIKHALFILYTANTELTGLYSLYATQKDEDRLSKKVYNILKRLDKNDQ